MPASRAPRRAPSRGANEGLAREVLLSPGCSPTSISRALAALAEDGLGGVLGQVAAAAVGGRLAQRLQVDAGSGRNGVASMGTLCPVAFI